MTDPNKKFIKPYKFIEQQRMKQKIQKYFDLKGKNSLKEEFAKEVYIHNIEYDNFPGVPLLDKCGLPLSWTKIHQIVVDYDHITFALGASFVYVSESGEWKPRLFFESNPEGWKEVGVWIQADLRYKDIICFDPKPTEYNHYLPHIYAYFQYSGTPFYKIRYALCQDAPAGFYLDPTKQITVHG